MFLRASNVAAAVAFCFLAACGTRNADPIDEFVKGRQAVVFVFLASDCPLSQAYASTLNDLRTQFQANGIEFYAVFSDQPGASDFAARYKLAFPVRLDLDFRLADYFGATKTPETFVVDSAGLVVYRGAIDNRAPDIGQQRTVVTERYLFDALNDSVLHRNVRQKQTPAVGCFIERRKQG